MLFNTTMTWLSNVLLWPLSLSGLNLTVCPLRRYQLVKEALGPWCAIRRSSGSSWPTASRTKHPRRTDTSTASSAKTSCPRSTAWSSTRSDRRNAPSSVCTASFHNVCLCTSLRSAFILFVRSSAMSVSVHRPKSGFFFLVLHQIYRPVLKNVQTGGSVWNVWKQNHFLQSFSVLLRFTRANSSSASMMKIMFYPNRFFCFVKSGSCFFNKEDGDLLCIW